MCDEPPIVSRCKAGNMRLTRANEIRGGSINYFGCDTTGCSCAYKELPFACLCRLCAQPVGKNVAVISFKDDHGQWHSVHHKFEARMLMGDDGAYPQVMEFKPRKLHPCSLVGTQWECQKSRKISKDEQICQAGPLGSVHVKCYRHVFDTEVDKFENWRLGFAGTGKRSNDSPILAEPRGSKKINKLDLKTL